MKKNFLLKSDKAERLYFDCARDLPIIDFHNHIVVSDIKSNRKYENISELWLAPDPYKHRLMRICGVDEYFITGNSEPFEKFQKFCEIFPYLAGNPVYDWSRMELSEIFGITDTINRDNAKKIYDAASEMLSSEEFSCQGILSRFNIEYQSPMATLLEDISGFDGIKIAPSLRADELLEPTEDFISKLSQKSGIAVNDEGSYLKAVSVMFDAFSAKGCKFCDHSLDAGFFKDDKNGKRSDILSRLALEYANRGWTLLLHINAKRKTSPRLSAIAGPAGGYAAAGECFEISELCDLLGKTEAMGKLPDTVIFPLNMSDQAPIAIMQGSFSENGKTSKVQLGPAWWWCDHSLGILNTLNSIASFGVLSQFIGMTTDSRSILSFIRHDYFRRLLCSFIEEKDSECDWDLARDVKEEIVKKICYLNAKNKIKGDI